MRGEWQNRSSGRLTEWGQAVKVLMITEKERRMQMMTLSELKERKRELGLTNKDIAERAFMPLSTVEKVFGGTVSSPRRDTLMKLSMALDEGTFVYDNMEQGVDPDVVSDVKAAYSAEKKKTSYTMDDYWRISEIRRVELIDGQIYDMASPSINHQTIVMDIFLQLMKNKNECNKDCYVFASPATVQLDADDRTGLQPDVLVVCDKDKVNSKTIFGAPDFVLEVVSPGNRSYDMNFKLHKYSDAGCKEYWIVDYERNQILKYDFTQDTLIEIFTFDDKVPVAISGNKCAVDFKRIKEQIETGVQLPL